MSEGSLSIQEIREYVKQFQLYADREAFNKLLDIYYLDACRYASKFLSHQLYSDSIRWSYEEVSSYVFIAFWKAVKNYRWNDIRSVSFKNYLYQLIKYETMHELKRVFACKEVQDLDKKWYKETEEAKLERDDSSVLERIVLRGRVSTIYEFLLPKGRDYALIWELKSQGVKNLEIRERLQLSDSTFKSKWQYIKKLILKAYPSVDKIY
ncbi:RNA polymerase sigma factor [Candidatus Mycoplasma haematominutum]|uniref:RNA polymerase factor sigma-70, ECF subfamily n=1 Tax=Candidatus Mycoplasma haematominutum 'Birmingham 1' TaxID=1116213 RepID=G8C3T4_9MOLU|nr:sigma factor [Candidatus Mycoplasma haematominutum]CCE66982.1 RNA polymerase factor sigma-70, ECF subfamily [Candidatus Mycoplasma haematominutum 'Birmingham 1']